MILDDDNLPLDDTPTHILIEYARQQVARAEPAVPSRGEPDIPVGSIPGYTLKELIYGGGQGIVYKAIQDSTALVVAIKVLRSGRFSDAVERLRFRRELDVLAKLRHPNIVWLRDGGMVDGVPYLVMDYIEGLPLQKYVDSQDLSINDRLKLFVKICAAVSAAHVRGVIHRDLKPGNILVDGHGEPRVLDFGLAKLTSSEDADDGITITGQFLGSLRWASPEQVRGTSDEIDVRTDVHALGLILYRLLTGESPFESLAITRASLYQIIETEAQPPSRVNTGVSGELDTITLKCLAKSPSRRYQSADAVAADVRRYLDGRPIDARADSTFYQLRKLTSRHRKTALMLALFVVLSIVYGITMTAMYQRASSAEHEAQQSANRAQAGFRKSLDAVELLIYETADRLDELNDADEAKRPLFEKAYEQLEELSGLENDDPRLRADYARTLRVLGDIDQDLGRYKPAYDLLQQALAIREELCAQDPDDLDRQADRSIALVRVGDLARALGDMDTTKDRYTEALEIDEELFSQEPDNPHYISNLVWSYNRIGALADREADIEAARDYFKRQLQLAGKLLEVDPDNSDGILAQLDAHGQLKMLANRYDDWDGSLRHGQQMLALTEQLYASDPSDVRLRRRMAGAYLANAVPLSRKKEFDRAWEYMEKARAFIEPLMAVDDRHKPNLEAQILYHRAGAAIASQQGDRVREYEQYRAALTWQEHLAAIDPDNIKINASLVALYADVARQAARSGDLDLAESCSRRGIAAGQRFVQRGTSTARLLASYGRLLRNAYPADLLDPAESLRLTELAVERTKGRSPELLGQLAAFHRDDGNLAESVDALQRALACPGVSGSPLEQHILDTLRTTQSSLSEGR